MGYGLSIFNQRHTNPNSALICTFSELLLFVNVNRRADMNACWLIDKYSLCCFQCNLFGVGSFNPSNNFCIHTKAF